MADKIYSSGTGADTCLHKIFVNQPVRSISITTRCRLSNRDQPDTGSYRDVCLKCRKFCENFSRETRPIIFNTKEKIYILSVLDNTLIKGRTKKLVY